MHNTGRPAINSMNATISKHPVVKIRHRSIQLVDETNQQKLQTHALEMNLQQLKTISSNGIALNLRAPSDKVLNASELYTLKSKAPRLNEDAKLRSQLRKETSKRILQSFGKQITESDFDETVKGRDMLNDIADPVLIVQSVGLSKIQIENDLSGTLGKLNDIYDQIREHQNNTNLISAQNVCSSLSHPQELELQPDTTEEYSLERPILNETNSLEKSNNSNKKQKLRYEIMNQQLEYYRKHPPAAQTVKRTLSFGPKNLNLEIITDMIHPAEKLSGLVQNAQTPQLENLQQPSISRMRDRQSKTTKHKSVVAYKRGEQTNQSIKNGLLSPSVLNQTSTQNSHTRNNIIMSGHHERVKEWLPMLQKKIKPVADDRLLQQKAAVLQQCNLEVSANQQSLKQQAAGSLNIILSPKGSVPLISETPTMLSSTQQNAQKMSLAAKAGEMQIFSSDPYSYTSNVLNTAQTFRKQANGSNPIYSLNFQRTNGNSKLVAKKPSFDPMSQLTSSLQIDSTEYSNSLPPSSMQKNLSIKDDKSFQPSLQGIGVQLQSQINVYKDVGHHELGFKPPQPLEDPQMQYKSRVLLDKGTDLTTVNTPHKNHFADGLRNNLGQSNQRRLHVSTSQGLIADQLIARTYDHTESLRQSPLRVELRNSAHVRESDLEKGKSLPPKRLFCIQSTQDQPLPSLNNQSILVQPLQYTKNSRVSHKYNPSFVGDHPPKGNSSERRSHNRSQVQTLNSLQMNQNVKRIMEQRMLIEGQPLQQSLNIADVQLFGLQLNGQRIKNTHDPRLDDQPFNHKPRQKHLPEVAGQGILTAQTVPQQFNHQVQLTEQLISQSPKPANIFANNIQPILHSTHFFYDYLFVQVSEEQYYRDYSSKLKLNERFADTRTDEDDIEQKLSGIKVAERQIGKHAKGTPEKLSQLHQLALSQYSDEKFESHVVGQAPDPYAERSDIQKQLPRRMSLESQDEKEAKPKKQVEAVEMFPFSLQQTQFECLKVMTPQNIITAYNEQRQRIGQTIENEIDKEQIVRDFMSELSIVFAEQNRRFKVTVKKKYINDILICSKGAQSVAQQVVLVVTDDSSLASNSAKKVRKVKRTVAASSDSEEDVLEEKTPKTKPGQKTPQVRSSKVQPSQFQRRGYDSESEAKSLNSTTTSSTIPQFGRKRVTETDGDSAVQPRKLHTRSLSQIPKSRTFKKDYDSATEGADATAKKVAQEEEKMAVHDRYPASKIKICQNVNAYDHLKTHPINKMFSDYNEFIRLVFKFRGTEQKYMNNVPFALKIAKRMGVPLTKAQLLPATLKVRENANLLKEKLIIAMSSLLQKENDIDDQLKSGASIFQKVVNQTTVAHVQANKEWIADPSNGKQLSNFYKCFVGKGNNSMLIRTLFKSRFWWLLHDKEEFDKVNFIWTQLRKKSVMEQFKCKLSLGNKSEFSQPMPNLKALNQSSEKFKKRKTSSANSRSPEHEMASDKLGQQKPSQMNLLSPGLSVDAQEKVPEVKPFVKLEMYPYRLYNKIEDNYHLANKKALLINMKHYYEAISEDPYNSLPVTFHIKEGLDDPEFYKFQTYYDANREKSSTNIWIIKPGENTNRGQGIQVAKDFHEIKSIIAESTRSKKRTCIVQKYIHNPLLIHRRKFDIRTYAMVTSVNGNYKAYFYEEGYLRTSCREFNVNNLQNKFIHLTNDAIQKKAEDYGKFEPGNKMSYLEFQSYLDKNHSPLNVCFERDILPQIKKLTTDCFRATWGKMDPNKRVNTFECYGLDFMIDDEFKVYLIEVNTNPCLELSSPLLARLIPSMVENSLRICVDPLFPPPENFSQKKHILHDLCPENKYELVFDEAVDGPTLEEIFKEKANVIVEIDEEELSDVDMEDNKVTACFD